MEPTIYKPGAHKSPGIYNGTGGIYNGFGVYKFGNNILPYYYTLFENFDISTKIDYPIIGQPTQYDTTNNYTYTNTSLVYEGNVYNALNIKNTANYITGNNLIPLKVNSYIEFICKINMVSSSAPAFMWTYEGVGFNVDWNKGSFIGVLAPSEVSSYETKNGAAVYNVSYGTRWFKTPQLNDITLKFRLDYLSDKIVCSVEGVEYVVFNKSNNDSYFRIDPRMNNNISITDIKCSFL